MKLQEALDEFTAGLLASGAIPDAIVKEMTADIAERVASGKVDQSLSAGQDAPSFVLKDAEGHSFSSGKQLQRGPLVITFFRGTWCPYCNLELRALEAARPDIEARGASLVAISMQDAANSRQIRLENRLGFPVLVDPGGYVAAQFGLRYDLSARIIELNETLGIDLRAFNGEDSGSLLMPGRYVVGQDGVVAYAEVNADQTQRPDPGDLLPILDRLMHRQAR